MHFSINREKLSNAIQHVSKAVSSRTTIPILTGIKIVSQQNGLVLTASDSDISIDCMIQTMVDGEEIISIKRTGSVVVPARFFGEIIRKLPDNIVEIEVNEKLTIMIRSGNSEFNLNGMDAEEYPNLPHLEEEQVFSIPADLLKTVIKQTVFAAATSETRPIFTGVHFSLEEEKLTVVATDSHRLANRDVVVETAKGLFFQNVVIPSKSLLELNKILDESDKLVDIVVTNNQVLIKFDNILFYSRLLEGTFPDTTRIIPQNNKTEIVLQTKEFLQAIERASLLAGDGKNNVVRLITKPDKMIEVSSNTPEVGKAVELVSARDVQGEELKISFNAKYMLEALRAIDSSEIRIGFTGTMSPFVIRPADNDWILQLILPVRTYQ